MNARFSLRCEQVSVPEGLALLEVDLIKLTAQFVARNGKDFLSGLMSRELANPQFGFLKPTHSLFPFFTSMADAYSKVLMPPKGTQDKLRADATDLPSILQRSLHRLEWDRTQQKCALPPSLARSLMPALERFGRLERDATFPTAPSM